MLIGFQLSELFVLDKLAKTYQNCVHANSVEF
jgi:hypothetical protein